MRTAHSTGANTPAHWPEEEILALSCRAVAKSIPDGAMLAFDQDFRVRQVGGMGLAEFGWTIEQTLGQSLLDLLRPLFPPDWEGEKVARTALAGGQETFQIEFEQRHFKLIFTPVQDSAGAYGLVFIRNVTSLVRSREALREREQLFESFIHNFPNGAVLIYDEALRYVLCDGQGLTASGLSRELMQGRTFYEVFPPDFCAANEHHYLAALAGQQVAYEVEYAGHYYDVQIAPVTYGGRPAGLFVAHIVTDKVKMVQKLQEREQLFEALVGNFPGVVGIFDKDLRFLLRGGKGRRFGPSGAEFQGPTIWQALPPSLAAQEEPHYRAAIAGQASSHDWQEDGRYYSVNLVPIAHEGNPAGLFVGQDVTETRRSEVELLRSRDEVQRLATELLRAQEIERSRIARELHDDFAQRIALLGIELSGLQDLAAVRPENVELGEGLTRLEKHVETLAEDIRNLSHRLHPALLEHVGLATAVRAHCEDLTQRAAFTVETFITPGSIDLGLDAQLDLYRIAQEALHNARRHSGAPGASVRLERVDDLLRLTVRDTGRGCDPASLPAGGGLGLLTMNERLRRHGGHCDFVSQPGGGASVIATVPLRH